MIRQPERLDLFLLIWLIIRVGCRAETKSCLKFVVAGGRMTRDEMYFIFID